MQAERKEDNSMHEDRSFLWPIIGGLVVTILFCSVMLVRGTGEKPYQV